MVRFGDNLITFISIHFTNEKEMKINDSQIKIPQELFSVIYGYGYSKVNSFANRNIK